MPSAHAPITVKDGQKHRVMCSMNSCGLYRVRIMEYLIQNMDEINSLLITAPITLIHNDCNPRNLCLRKSRTKSKNGQDCRTCLYDWELATLDVPQRDLAEFLTFTLMPSISFETRVELVNYYKCNLEKYSGIDYPVNRYV